MIQNYIDSAREWLNEHCPDLAADEFEAKVQEVAAELAALAAAANTGGLRSCAL